VFQGNTVGEHLEVIHDAELKKLLFEFYAVNSDEDLITACENDWRYCIPKDIAVDGFIPRTPYVKLENDDNWKPLSAIEDRLLDVVEEKRKSNQITRRK
jgi:hypothetical protein